MKRFYIPILKKAVMISLLLLFIACDNSELETLNESQNVAQVKPSVAITPFGLSFHIDSKSNPELHAKWETVDKIILNNGFTIDAPWIYRSGNTMVIPYNYRTDIKSIDGWTMLSHTMLDVKTAEPNYILFYNNRTGVLKLFYYSEIVGMNKDLLWIMQSESGATSLFGAEGYIDNVSNSYIQNYMTTSPIYKTTNYTWGALVGGWNSCSFELAYGTTNPNPKISIGGFNEVKIELEMAGKYSGEVLIPVEKEEESSITKYLSKMGSVLSSIGKFIPQIKGIGDAVSGAGKVLGSTVAQSTKTTINTRATSSGEITLTGDAKAKFGGIVLSTNDLDLKQMNQSKNIGVWGLKEVPKYTYNGYIKALEYYDDDYNDFSNYIKLATNEYPKPLKSIESLIEINPEILPLIEGYRVKSELIHKLSDLPRYDKITKLTPTLATTSYVYSTMVRRDYWKFNVVHVSKARITPSPKLNITIEFKYKDGTTVLSSRSVAVILEYVDNQYDLLREINMQYRYPNLPQIIYY